MTKNLELDIRKSRKRMALDKMSAQKQLTSYLLRNLDDKITSCMYTSEVNVPKARHTCALF